MLYLKLEARFSRNYIFEILHFEDMISSKTCLKFSVIRYSEIIIFFNISLYLYNKCEIIQIDTLPSFSTKISGCSLFSRASKDERPLNSLRQYFKLLNFNCC